jgi:hypothetical protein
MVLVGDNFKRSSDFFVVAFGPISAHHLWKRMFRDRREGIVSEASVTGDSTRTAENGRLLLTIA